MDKRHIRKIKRRDRIARWLITVGGVSVIACVLTMLVLIASTAVLMEPKPVIIMTGAPGTFALIHCRSSIPFVPSITRS